VTEQREELLTDSASKLVLLKAGEERNIHFRELAELTGVDHYRVKKLARELEKHSFISFEKGLYLDVGERNVNSLGRFKDNIEQFAESNKTRLLKNNLEASKRIKQRLDELKENKEATDSMRKEKRIEKQIENIENVLSRRNGFESAEDVLKTSARISRIGRLFCGSQDLHGCNIERKAKCFATINLLFEGRLR